MGIRHVTAPIVAALALAAASFLGGPASAAVPAPQEPTSLSMSPASAMLPAADATGGWHNNSVFYDSGPGSTMVIDCMSTIINNMAVPDPDSGYIPITFPTTGIMSWAGAEVDVDGAHPRAGETFYLHFVAEAVSTPCTYQGGIPVFQLPSGMTVDTGYAIQCYLDGARMTSAADCPQSLDDAYKNTGAPRGTSWQYLAPSGIASRPYWPIVGNHLHEWWFPVKSSTTYNMQTLKTWLLTGKGKSSSTTNPQFYYTGSLPFSSPLNVFSAGSGSAAPGGTPQQPISQTGNHASGTAYRITYDTPSTVAAASYSVGATTYGLLSSAQIYTNGNSGYVAIVRSTSKTKVTNDPINQDGIYQDFTLDPGTLAYRADYDWGDSGVPAIVPGTTYYWRVGFAPNGSGAGGANPDPAKSSSYIWGPVQSFVGLTSGGGATCNGLPVTVSIALHQQPTSGADVILGTPGKDVITGLGGNDTICGGGGSDVVFGGDGNDWIDGGDGNDVVDGGAGTNTLRGGAGNDTVSYQSFAPASGTTGAYINLSSSVATAGAISDTLNSFENAIGSAYDDQLFGDGNDNLLVGGNGNDYISDDLGNDNVSGGNGNDTLLAGQGNDKLYGGAGTDVVDYSAATGAVSVDLRKSSKNETGWGTDTIKQVENLTGTGYNDTLIGDNHSNVIDVGDPQGGGLTGNDAVHGEGGNDRIVAYNGTDVLYGDSGSDTLDLSLVTQAVTVNLGVTVPQAIDASLTASLHSVENVNGGSGADTITGNSSSNTIHGGNSPDTLAGGGGNDKLYGEAGNDTLNGGSGDDVLDGGDGIGDTLSYAGTSKSVTVSLAKTAKQDTKGAGRDTVSHLEFLTGGNGNDTLTGDSGDNAISGGPGNDTLIGGDGTDTLRGGDGNDTLRGGKGTDYLIGEVGFDWADYSDHDAQISVDQSSHVGGNPSWEGGTQDTVGADTEGVIAPAAGSAVEVSGSTASAVRGSTGNDLVEVDGDAPVTFSPGNGGSDAIVNNTPGGAGDPAAVTLDYSSAKKGVKVDLRSIAPVVGDSTPFIQSTGVDSLTIRAIDVLRLVGGSHSDTLHGNARDNTLTGNGGNDALYGDAGIDTCSGGSGSDRAYQCEHRSSVEHAAVLTLGGVTAQ